MRTSHTDHFRTALITTLLLATVAAQDPASRPETRAAAQPAPATAPGAIFPGSELPDESGALPYLVFNLRAAEDGHPLAGAVVRIWEEQEPPFPPGWKPVCEAYADAGGWARIALKDCHGTTPWISYEAPGYGARIDFNGPSDDGEIVLSRAVAVPVHVFDMLGRPVPDAHVGMYLGCGHTPEFATATTDAHGDAVLPGIDPTIGTVWAMGADAASEEIMAWWAPGCAPLQIECAPAPVMRGTVVGARHTSAGTLAVGSGQWHRGPWTRANADGTFALRGGRTVGPAYLMPETWVFDLASRRRWEVPRAPLGLAQHIDLAALDAPPVAFLTEATIEVVDGATSRPCADAVVTSVDRNNTPVATVAADAAGIATLRVPAVRFGVVVASAIGAFPRVVLREQQVNPVDRPLRIAVRRYPTTTVLQRDALDHAVCKLVTPESTFDVTELIERDGVIPVPDNGPSALRVERSRADVFTVRLDGRAPESRATVTVPMPPMPGVIARFVDMTGRPVRGFISFRDDLNTYVDPDPEAEARQHPRWALDADGRVVVPNENPWGARWCRVDSTDGKVLGRAPLLRTEGARRPVDLGTVRLRCGSDVGGVTFVTDTPNAPDLPEMAGFDWKRGAHEERWRLGEPQPDSMTFQPGDTITLTASWFLPHHWTIGSDAKTVLKIGTGSLTVTARGPGDAALDEVWVAVDGHSAMRSPKTDPPGTTLMFSGVRAGRHEVVISSPGLISQVSMPTWQPGEHKQLNVTLER